MALYYDLPVFKQTYDLTMKVFIYTQEFPREYKYSLGQDMKHDCLRLMRSIYRANKAHDKQEYLDAFLDEFEVLKLEIRLCADMRILPRGKQAELASLMASIGKQIIGWRRSS